MVATRAQCQRTIDHGEVFTPTGLVRDMLDLPGVAEECTRIDARFLEPACGDGNFLLEVLRRRLDAISKKRPKLALSTWERHALRGLANLYGIELLPDNVQACRDRLAGQFTDVYQTRFPKAFREQVIDAARHITAANIHFGDALAMTTPGDKVHPARPLIFTQWSMLSFRGGGWFKRKRFEYRELAAPRETNGSTLFGQSIDRPVNEDGKPVFLAQPVDDLPLVHYLKLGQEPHPASLPAGGRSR